MYAFIFKSSMEQREARFSFQLPGFQAPSVNVWFIQVTIWSLNYLINNIQELQ